MANINGTSGSDVLFDTPGDDTIQAFGGDDTVTVPTGRDYADGSTGEDTIVIRYGNASQGITVLESGGTRAYINSGPLGWEDSTRRIDFDRFEHLDVTTGSGNDDIHGVSFQWDKIDGGAGIDLWRDSWAFMADPVALDLDMTLASSAGGQTLADTTTVRNIEQVNLSFAGKDDRFSDHGSHDDYVNGLGGNDWFRTSGGRDVFDCDTGEDTVRIDWGDATQTVTIVESGGTRGWVHTDGADWETSTRRVDFERIEHLDVRSGSGDDDIHGVSGKWDAIDGGGGVDLWRDDFSAFDKAVVIDMAAISSPAGQVLSDGSEIRNVETVDLGFTAFDDQYRDFGNQNDRLNGRGGDDVFSTTGGRDLFDGDTGEDTVRRPVRLC